MSFVIPTQFSMKYYCTKFYIPTSARRALSFVRSYSIWNFRTCFHNTILYANIKPKYFIPAFDGTHIRDPTNLSLSRGQWTPINQAPNTHKNEKSEFMRKTPFTYCPKSGTFKIKKARPFLTEEK